MKTYIERNPNPHRRQYTEPRRALVSGAIVVHTGEIKADLTGLDDGAERLAKFMSNRTDAGSYHTPVDSDSILPFSPYIWEAWGEGTGGNRHALHLSFACEAARWNTYPSDWVRRIIDNGAREAARMAEFVLSTRGITIPATRLDRTQYRARQPGFIDHGRVDPGRRSDPGRDFPWDMFLNRFTHYVSHGHGLGPHSTHTGGTVPEKPFIPTEYNSHVNHWQSVINPSTIKPDGLFGKLTLERSLGKGREWVKAEADLADLTVELKRVRGVLAEAQAELVQTRTDLVECLNGGDPQLKAIIHQWQEAQARILNYRP